MTVLYFGPCFQISGNSGWCWYTGHKTMTMSWVIWVFSSQWSDYSLDKKWMHCVSLISTPVGCYRQGFRSPSPFQYSRRQSLYERAHERSELVRLRSWLSHLIADLSGQGKLGPVSVFFWKLGLHIQTLCCPLGVCYSSNAAAWHGGETLVRTGTHRNGADQGVDIAH